MPNISQFQTHILPVWAHLWRSDVFARASDASGLQLSLRINSKIPSMLNEILDLKYCWQLSIKVMKTLRLSTVNVGRHHLYITVPTKAT